MTHLQLTEDMILDSKIWRSRVFWKQPFYLHEVGVRSAYTLPSPDLFCGISLDIMDQKYQLPFKEGQTAEARSFEVGFRGAWFQCKIQEISCRRGHWSALLQYFDYPDEKWTWTKLYQVPPYQSGKSKEIRQLMLRPEYPLVHHKNEVSDVSSNSDVTIVLDGTWEAGDLVDWWYADCYWSGKVTKLLGNDKAEIELVRPPLGEGATYEVFIKDMRPSLDWSPEFGWAVPASQDGESSCQDSQLLKHVSQGHAIGEGRRNRQATTGSSSNSYFSTSLSGNLPPDGNRDFKTTEFVDSKDAANGSNDTSGLSSSLQMCSSPPVSYFRYGTGHPVDFHDTFPRMYSSPARSVPPFTTSHTFMPTPDMIPPQGNQTSTSSGTAPAARQLQRGQTDSLGKVYIVPDGAGFSPSKESVRALKESIRKHYQYPYPSWGEIPEHIRKSMFDEFETLCTWLPKYNNIIFTNFEKKAGSRMSDWFYDARRKNKKPDWLLPHLYDQLRVYWRTPEFLAKSEQAKKSRR